MNLMIVSGMFVCSSFLISVGMFIPSKSLLISSATVIVRAWGSHLVEPFYYGVPVLCECVWYVSCYVRKYALHRSLCNY